LLKGYARTTLTTQLAAKYPYHGQAGLARVGNLVLSMPVPRELGFAFIMNGGWWVRR
jgi:hypothetical protein